MKGEAEKIEDEPRPDIVPVTTEVIEDWEPKSEKEVMAADIVKILQEKGVAYFAGGYVRDILIGRKEGKNILSGDIDIATELPHDAVAKILEEAGFKVDYAGKRFGVNKVHHEKFKGVEIDVATFRKED